MKQKIKVLFILMLFLLPLIYLSERLKFGNNGVIIETEPLKITNSSDDFDIKLFIGDPFGKSYSSYEFTPDDAVLLTGSIKNTGYTGSPTDQIEVRLWLVSGKTSTLKVESIGNYSKPLSTYPIGTSYTLKELNDDNYVGFEVANIPAGSYYIMAEVLVEDSLNSQGFSGKPLIFTLVRLADFNITAIFYDLWWGFEYNITNTGNCEIEGYFNAQIEKWDNSEGWFYLDELNSLEHTDGGFVNIPIGSSLIGNATWTTDGQLDHTEIARLYISITDSQGNILENLNNSIPFDHPTQGGRYIDSNKLPSLVLDRQIARPTDFGTPEQVNVSLSIKVIGQAPDYIGVFTRHGEVQDNCTNLELVETLSEALSPYLGSSLPYLVEGGSSGVLSLTGNNLTLNSVSIPELAGLDLNSQLDIKYTITANFSRIINKPWSGGSSQLHKSIGYGEGLVHPSNIKYNSFKDSALYDKAIFGTYIPPPQDPYSPNGTLGIIVWYGRLVDLYGEAETIDFLQAISEWQNYLHTNTGIESVVYCIDNHLKTHSSLGSMGFLEPERISIISMSQADAAEYIHNNVDPDTIAKAIEKLVTAEAQEEKWDYMLLIGGVDTIPMRIVDHPLQPYGQVCSMFDCKDWSNSEIATDFFYGDFDPEAETWQNRAFIPEVMVGRIPGRSIEDMQTLLEAGQIPSTGRPLVISYYKGEDSARKIIDSWGVKSYDALLDSEDNFTREKINETLNPSSYGSPSNFPYSFILYSNHGGISSFTINQTDVSTWQDYVDGSRPFVFLRACLSGYIGDTGEFWSGETHTAEESIALDYLAKGIAGMLASTRISYSPPPDPSKAIEYDFHDGGNTAIKPSCGSGVPDSLSGVYYEGTIKFEGRDLNVLEIDNHKEDYYWMTIFDFNDNGIYEYDEIYKANHPDWKERRYFISPYNGFAGYRLDVEKMGGKFSLTTNSEEDWNDIFCAIFTGHSGEGIMDGLNVGEAFLNAREKYAVYSLLMRLSGFHVPYSEEDCFDTVTSLAYNLYGIPFYRPNIVDPPGAKNYTLTNSSMDAWGFNCTLGIENYTHTKIGEHDLFEILGAMLTSGTDLPRLPMIMENITIPKEFSIGDIQILENISTILPGTYNITLSSAGANDSSDLLLDKKTLSGIYPDKRFDYTIIEGEDESTLYLAIYPFSFDSDTGKVEYYSNLTLHIDFKDTPEDSISLAVIKNIENIGGNSYKINLDLANNGSSYAYDIQISEEINNKIEYATGIYMLSTSGHNGSYLLSYSVEPFIFFSNNFPFKTTISCKDASGTQWSMTITTNIYMTSYLGIIIIVVACIVALGITMSILILRSRK